MKSLALRIAAAILALVIIAPSSAVLAEPGLGRSEICSPHLGSRKVEQTIEEWDPVKQRWMRVGSQSVWSRDLWRGTPSTQQEGALARFGPFVVLDERIAALVDTTNRHSPAHFQQMIAAFPQLEVLSFIDAPGTVDDIANLQLGRRIRASGLTTYIPGNGSARSGAVELFLAGKEHIMDEGALFAVHAWRDNYGRGPSDYGQNDPVNRLYLDYYIEMGMTETEAHAFYEMTNSVPHSSALWFGPDQMRRWIEPQANIRSVALQWVQIPYVLESLLEPALTTSKLAFNDVGYSFIGNS